MNYIFSEMTANRDYLNDHPACRAATQTGVLDGTVYRENGGTEAFDALLRGLRKGDTVRVFRPFLLAPTKGRPSKRRRVWAERAEKIKAKGACLVSIPPALSGPSLAMFAYEEIANVARGRAGQSRPGRPRHKYPKDTMRIIERHWPPRKGQTWDKAVDKINSQIAPHNVTRGWLYANVK